MAIPHRPYIELQRAHLDAAGAGWPALAAWPPLPKVHYDELLSRSGTKVYAQKRTVAARPDPPKDGRFWHCNNRPEG